MPACLPIAHAIKVCQCAIALKLGEYVRQRHLAHDIQLWRPEWIIDDDIFKRNSL
jgi:hypothetical protein